MKKKIELFLSVILICITFTSVTAKTIASFKRGQYMLGPDIQFSPDGKSIAFIAKDGKKYYGPSYLYTGSSISGSFKKVFNDPVDQYVWKSSSEIIFSIKEKDSVTVKSGNPGTGKSIILFTRKLQMKGSGYTRGYENFTIKAISPSGEFVIVEKDKGACVLVHIPDAKEIALEDFSIPYSGNPSSTLRFSGNSKRLLLFDGKDRKYRLYEVSLSGLKLLKKTGKIKNIIPGSDYLINDEGAEIIFTEEKCKGGCYHIVYIYNIMEDRLYENIKIKSGQILRVAFDRRFKVAVINDMHQSIKIFILKKKGKELK